MLLAAAMVACAKWAYQFGQRPYLPDPKASDLPMGTIDAAVLSLLGLLVAFVFSNAYSRYEIRRQLVVDEVNAIDTAYVCIDLLPAALTCT